MFDVPLTSMENGWIGTGFLLGNDGDGRNSCGFISLKWEEALIPNPIRKVLLTFCENRVQYLLMGGQACVLYGGAEFSRDTDFAVCGDTRNLGKIQHVLEEESTERSLDVEYWEPLRRELEHLRHGIRE